LIISNAILIVLNELLKLPALLLHLLSMLVAHLLPSSPPLLLFQVAVHVSTASLKLLPQVKKLERRAMGKMVRLVRLKVILVLSLLFHVFIIFF
jgi:hypothetical protein